jgi:hypothetical protein
MKTRHLAFAVIGLSFACSALNVGGQSLPTDPYLTAHEWGTFTSIAGADGHAVEWTPLTGSEDLPSFVEHFGGVQLKGGLLGTVRMETPVLYFYTNRDTTVSVHVSFSKGLITEWYPHADRVYPVSAVPPKFGNFRDWSLYQDHPDGSIEWDSVQLQPRSFAELPLEKLDNYYYAARQTGSTPLQIKTGQGAQTEKFLFYRGVSTFAPPISVRIQGGGRVLAENVTHEEIPAMLLFERRGERLGFRVVHPSAHTTTLDSPELNADMNSLKQTVVDLLAAQGLYQDEAQAMFETWRDSWFEEGSRLLYIVPRPFVDLILPLSINPAPSQTVRVFVGRMELVTPATLRAVEQALAARDRVTLARYGRFLMPIVAEIVSDDARRLTPEQITEYYETASSVPLCQTSIHNAGN